MVGWEVAVEWLVVQAGLLVYIDNISEGLFGTKSGRPSLKLKICERSKARIESLELLDNWRDKERGGEEGICEGGRFLEKLHNCYQDYM
ncbi:hypothetical protein TWF569_003596 [Orbilia oligospora]|uniref:Uncharacterized protein n=1 Tax=Orbilia oligospora TaxID=2813651 RepID=A0A7C8NIF2_ORBOL|nr:hypothetical protein TWF706_001489 [Orbilia oligospora]KAF3097301.1 hypothetical protein TWF103_009593 [Orbilia oligospora]KAF3103161.1 hypothetical protein TWF102_003975 [Orbilia oligospora]KAF3119741.1 hypothetical protein TWF569_003596 [Orbilia oligospora]